ncbi:MAG: hypothetical protein II557_02130 [Clostridia bacterium]|nr:hypothetical protein [Clostridia bacterium]MBR4185105.1 hypothetical protein [Clostridia bacterium]
MKRLLFRLGAWLFALALSVPVFADAALPGEEDLYQGMVRDTQPNGIVWAVIGVILVAAALLVWFLVKRRRK